MNLFRFVILTGIIAFQLQIALAQSPHKKLREGDLYYNQGEFLAAEEAYRKAGSGEKNAQAEFNLGNAIYEQERYDEAVQHFEAAAEASADPLIKARAYHNLGNTHFRAQALDKSVSAYRNALKLNPDDLDTKKNLTMALQQLQQQQQQQQQQQNQQEQKEEQQEQQQQQQQPNEQQQQQQQETSDQPEERDAQQSSEDLTREEAEELLRIIDNEDSKVQEKLRKTTANPKKPKKDW